MDDGPADVDDVLPTLVSRHLVVITGQGEAGQVYLTLISLHTALDLRTVSVKYPTAFTACKHISMHKNIIHCTLYNLRYTMRVQPMIEMVSIRYLLSDPKQTGEGYLASVNSATTLLH